MISLPLKSGAKGKEDSERERERETRTQGRAKGTTFATVCSHAHAHAHAQTGDSKKVVGDFWRVFCFLFLFFYGGEEVWRRKMNDWDLIPLAPRWPTKRRSCRGRLRPENFRICTFSCLENEIPCRRSSLRDNYCIHLCPESTHLDKSSLLS